jgi:PIN domain nuclease of toxin-antitoxin system
MPDRIIVATALHLGFPLISRDEAIQRAAVVPIVW